MSSNIEEVIALPDFSETTSMALDGYCQLFLTAIHNQETNRILGAAEAQGMTADEVKKELDRLRMQPKVVNQFNLEPDKKEETGKTEEADTSYI
jgi:hypothetical protein